MPTPIKRARQHAAEATLGEVVPLPRTVHAVKPKGWRKMPDSQKSVVCLGLSFERAFDYLSWDPNEIDAHRLSAQKELVRAMVHWCFRKYLEDRKDSRTETALLSKMAERLLGIDKPLDLQADANDDSRGDSGGGSHHAEPDPARVQRRSA